MNEKIGNCRQEARLIGSKWNKYESLARVYSEEGLCPTLTTCSGGHHQVKIQTKSGIRKLTPREYWRLMGFDDSDFDKAQEVSSDTQLYKQAGNSIVVNVLQGIMSNLLVSELLKYSTSETKEDSMDRRNTALNEAIEQYINTWDGTIYGQCVRNMYENGDSYEHICEAANINIEDYEED